MQWSDPIVVGSASAVAGAAIGWLGTWLLDRRKERRLDSRASEVGQQEKLHQLEVRIAQVERDMVHALRFAELIRRRR